MNNQAMTKPANQAMTLSADQDSRIANMLPPKANVSHAIQLMGMMLDKRIATARTYPRSVSRFLQEATDLLTNDVDTARSAEYSKPIGQSSVRGPSVRLAELAAMCWGNLDIEIEEPVLNDDSVTVTAYATDLEKNNKVPGIASTSIMDRNGKRLANHMIETVKLATASKAKRNAILNVIPRAYITRLLEQAKLVASNNEKPLDEIREEMFAFFGRTYKVQPEQIFELLQVEGAEDIKSEHIDELRAVATGLKEGATVEEYFAPKATSKAEEVKAKVAERRSKQAKPAAEPATPADGKLFDNAPAQKLPD